MLESSAGKYLRELIPLKTKPKEFFSSYVLNLDSASVLIQSASEDARKYVYNAVVSFLAGISGLHNQQAGWTVTKMYYTAFYIGRAALCRARHVIFHIPKESGKGYTQYEIIVEAGQRANIVSSPPSTHKLVAQRFQQTGYPVFMRGLTIDGIDPLLWLMDKREYWQYRSARFPDPESPSILEKFDTRKAQRLLAEYIDDSKGVYLSDPDHAIISIPFRLVQWALSIDSLLSPGIVNVEDVTYLRKRCCIGKQTLSSISQYLKH
jgi:hypothetical protein